MTTHTTIYTIYACPECGHAYGEPGLCRRIGTHSQEVRTVAVEVVSRSVADPVADALELVSRTLPLGPTSKAALAKYRECAT